MHNELPLYRLKELLHYNPYTGIFKRIVDKGSAKKGDISGSFANGYLSISIDGIDYRAHRLAWFYYYGVWPEYCIDHIDRVKHHNWIDNLREASHSCNMINKDVLSNNTSGVTGVSPTKNTKKWRAQIQVYKKKISLGRFKEFPNAVKARWEAEKKYNFPNCCTTSTAYEYLKSNNLI